MDQEKIGKFIKEIRTKEKLSQQKFADKYGVTYQAVSKWENGLNIPDITILKKICDDYDISLDDFLETKRKPKKKIKLWMIITFIILLILLVFILVNIFKKEESNFEFKTLSTTCSDFNVYGSIAYNEKKSSIYISNINYCGGTDETKYEKLECTLYETHDKTINEISKYDSESKEKLTLEEFLKEVNFVIDNYEKTCKEYHDNSLYLEIMATINSKIVTYKIPLDFSMTCSTNN